MPGAEGRRWSSGLSLAAVALATFVCATVSSAGSAVARRADSRLASAAKSSSPIEGVWSFAGGEVVIEHAPEGTWNGTVVVAPTKFAECPHPIGEVMWKQIKANPDGSFSGFHQWFFEGGSCVRNEALGPTAWRVMEASGGAHFLRACFSAPGQGMPQIPPTGPPSGVGYGCVDSALISSPPTTSGAAGFRSAVSLPSARKCFSRRVFTIHLRDPHEDPLSEAVVSLRGRRLRVKRHGGVFVSRVDLRGLPRGTFTVRIQLVTVLGHRLGGGRTYHTCRPRRSHSGGR
jgi:hypothetical protein